MHEQRIERLKVIEKIGRDVQIICRDIERLDARRTSTAQRTFGDDDRLVIERIENVIDGVVVVTGDFVVSGHVTVLLWDVDWTEIGQLDQDGRMLSHQTKQSRPMPYLDDGVHFITEAFRGIDCWRIVTV